MAGYRGLQHHASAAPFFFAVRVTVLGGRWSCLGRAGRLSPTDAVRGEEPPPPLTFGQTQLLSIPCPGGHRDTLADFWRRCRVELHGK